MKKEEITLYRDLLGEIKTRVRTGQHRAALAANAELIALYWDIGRMIIAREYDATSFLQRDLVKLVPQPVALIDQPQKESPRNSDLAGATSDAPTILPIMQRSVAQLPWGINITLMEKLKHLPSSLPSIEDIENELTEDLGKEEDA